MPVNREREFYFTAEFRVFARDEVDAVSKWAAVLNRYRAGKPEPTDPTVLNRHAWTRIDAQMDDTRNMIPVPEEEEYDDEEEEDEGF